MPKSKLYCKDESCHTNDLRDNSGKLAHNLHMNQTVNSDDINMVRLAIHGNQAIVRLAIHGNQAIVRLAIHGNP